LRRDISIVAILRGVGARDEESLVHRGVAVNTYLVCLGLVGHALLQHLLDIGDGSPFACLGKLLAHKGIESHAAGAEKRVAVDHAIVQLVYLASVDDIDAFSHVQRYEQVPCQSVARPRGYDAQCRAGVYQRPCHLVYRAVAANGHHDIYPVVGGLRGQSGGMAGIFGVPDLIIEALLIKILLYLSGYLCLCRCAGYGVDDKKYSLLHASDFMPCKISENPLISP